MGPKIFSFTKGETLYSLRLIPIGGFCGMEGEDTQSSSSRAFCNKHPLKKIIILVSGALMNILLGFIAINIMFSFSESLPTTYIKDVKENTSAYTQGLKPGDKILKIDNKNVRIYSDISFILQFSDKDTVSVEVLRDNRNLEFNIVPYKENGGRYLGITMGNVKNNFLNLIKYSFEHMLFIVRMVIASLWMLLTGAVSIKEASGPVGIVSVINEATKSGMGTALFLNVLNIVSLISINLGVFNLIPLPALDGGRTVFAFFELITKKKVPAKVESIVNGVGLMALLILMLFITYNDIVKFF
jgi:regulator of sigma E protease